jgi:hypothetical protein
MRRIVVEIRRVVLAGVRPEDRHAFAIGLRRALERSFSEPDAWSRLSSLSDQRRLITDNLQLTPDTAPRAIGVRVGQHISRALVGHDHHRASPPNP